MYRVVSQERKDGARFGLEGWPEKVVRTNLEKLCSRERRLQRGPGSSFFCVPLVSQRLLQLRLPLTGKLLTLVRGARRVVISDFPIFQRPHHVMLLSQPAQGKLSPLRARGQGAKSRADLAISSKTSSAWYS